MQITRKFSDDHLRVAANDIEVSHTLFDFTLTFGTVRSADGTTAEIEDHVTVHLSPQLTKRLIEVVQTNVARYEGNLGEIQPMPKETVSAVGGGVVQ
jgi:hypothetical protein